jgi:hypothetical protein
MIQYFYSTADTKLVIYLEDILPTWCEQCVENQIVHLPVQKLKIASAMIYLFHGAILWINSQDEFVQACLASFEKC